MSDFNNMFAEQVAIEESTGATQRILEAMLKRDQMEIQYRQQGISESQIAQFHEASTQAINEALSDYVARGKGAAKRGWAGMKDAGNRAWGYAKEKGRALWERIKELFAKFVAFCKKIWVTIRNYFADDAKFYKKYEKELSDKENQTRYADEEYVGIKEFNRVPGDGLSVEKYNEFTDEVYSYRPENESSKKGWSGVLAAAVVLQDKKNGDALNDIIKADERKLHDNSDKDENEAKRLAAYLKALRAAQNTTVRITKARHKAAKSFIVRCVSKSKSVKESTIAFMVESCNTEIDRAYAFNEADENNKDDSREYHGVGDAYKSGKGAWGKTKAVAGAIWHNIVAFIKRCYDWVKGKIAAAWNWITKQWGKLKSWWTGEVEVTTVSDNAKKLLNLAEKVGSGNFNPNELPQLTAGDKLPQLTAGDKLLQLTAGDEELPRKKVSAAEAQRVMEENNNFRVAVERCLKQLQAIAEKGGDEAKTANSVVTLVKALQKFIARLTKDGIVATKDLMEQFIRAHGSGKSDEAKKMLASLKFEFAAIDNLMADSILESYQIMAEAAEVDDLLGKAASGDSMGVDNVSLASTDVLQRGASNDPFALTYDKDLYSQTVDMGDEHLAGTVGAEIGDTETLVKAGDQLAHEFALLDSMF